MSKHKLADGDAAPIIINDSSSSGGKGNGVRISHPKLLHGNGFKVSEPGLVASNIASDDSHDKGTDLVAPWIVVLNRLTVGAPIITLSSSDSKIVNVNIDETDFDITVFDHVQGSTHHFHPALTSDGYDIISISLLNGIQPGTTVENKVIVTGGGALIHFGPPKP